MSILSQYHHVHVVGAGGIGVSAAAKLFLLSGATVTGSDGNENEAVLELRMMGAKMVIGHEATNVPEAADLLMFTSAVPETNPERAEAVRRGIKQLSYFEFIGELSRERKTVAVSGTNGKSTTTALLGLMLEAAGMDPLVIVGSKVPGFKYQNLRPGEGMLVVEADESEAHMLELSPTVIVLTNIEADHLDYYRDIDHIRDTFQTYIDKLPKDGLLVMNAEDRESAKLRLPVTPVTFAIEGAADVSMDVMATSCLIEHGRHCFGIVRRGVRQGECELQLPGRFNVMNALAAATAALELGASFTVVQSVLAGFKGLWRRFERVADKNGILVISDYGHHPTAIAGTLAGARAMFPNRRMVLCFQPHQKNRTKNLFTEFVESFDEADVLVLPEIYAVAGREAVADAKVSSKQLVKEVQKRDQSRGVVRPVEFVADPEAALAWLRGNIQTGDVVLVMGAGSIYKIAPKIMV